MNKKLKLAIPVGVAVVAALIVWLIASGGNGQGELAASGTVEATEGQLGFQATGRIESVQVREGDRVKAGAQLAALDRAEMLARRDQAQAQVEAADALLDELQSGFRSEEVAQARAALNAARQRLADARRDLERTRNLFEGGAVSREALDKAQVALEVAESQNEQAEEQLRLLERGPRRERIEAQRAQLRQAEAALRAIEATLANMTIVAPFDGIVTIRHREPGEIVSPGAPVLTVMNPDDRWVRIYVKEDRIGAVKLGAPATITTDTYPENIYEGEVVFIASEAEFTPKNVQTKEERVKLVYAVKVQIVGDARLDLKPGIPADVRLELADANDR
ncbi:MAG: HlyD family efflux transporter periplasmic adaptor subunit [Gemmatimonadetes bacterium]|uniref:HlyD family efflux transporter periplasmic adaptor subunit n=1 Tax=Candidatus Kutchimonas denitrificans TaxID=3056748 RepID=A0AAE5CCL2_9BACT|nr:HlyD family efflux transporter periplasmic adaptor subunit [Gemmatimonadota bacterium]NIR75795.1 HlyD family efflux transporter periplasmic adaptor subunit [Candidatus Kutchimonas denitrificans]NIS01963.1 HlyD family efflux transporter periplasmic adaptor subunit [Gemmatimonadota bacterium]NIT67767.1 HlyD family efflux transporter periplasmic adaptor subunit [Gemmatimonadota bacterium]NIU53754.1 HlyD family efflux transporter periplasmic adaptor subunit [Gemmatimonadota bacterium]